MVNFQQLGHHHVTFSGGLISDLQRLLPLDSGSDLYLVKYPDVPASLLFYVRPFQPADEEAVYSLAADAYERTIDAPMGELLVVQQRTAIAPYFPPNWLCSWYLILRKPLITRDMVVECIINSVYSSHLS